MESAHLFLRLLRPLHHSNLLLGEECLQPVPGWLSHMQSFLPARLTAGLWPSTPGDGTAANLGYRRDE